MANNEILQIVVFSMFFGVALSALGEKGRTLVAAIDELAHVMLFITGYVMKLAPVACSRRWLRRSRSTASRSCSSSRCSWATFYLGPDLLWELLIFAASSSSAARIPPAGADQGSVHAVVRDRELGGRRIRRSSTRSIASASSARSRAS
jgi:hypothetical protein